MPDEGKKRWRVSTWNAETNIKEEAKRYEDTLNALDAEGYDIYEVDTDRRWAVGRLMDVEEEEAKEEEPASHPPFPVHVMTGNSLTGFLRAMASSMMRSAEPEREGNPRIEEGPIDYEPKGERTLTLMEGLHGVLTRTVLGDASPEARVDEVVRKTFANTTRQEMELSLKDLRTMHEQHKKGSCAPDCITDKILTLGTKRLEQGIEEKPMN